MQLVLDGTHYWAPDEDTRTIFHFGHCVGCRRPGLVSEVETGPEPEDRESAGQLWPTARTIDAKLPPRVDESFREATQCELAGAPLATAVMVRRTLEAIGKEFAPTAKPLFRALHAMKDKGLISEELALWGDELRFIGNIGAHPTDDIVTALDAREALDFLVAIVETIYVLRPKFQAMRARREKAKVTTAVVRALRERPPEQPPVPTDGES